MIEQLKQTLLDANACQLAGMESGRELERARAKPLLEALESIAHNQSCLGVALKRGECRDIEYLCDNCKTRQQASAAIAAYRRAKP